MHNLLKRFFLGSLLGTVGGLSLLVLPCSAQSYFVNRTSFTTGDNPVAAVAADFNGDGKLDLAVVNQGDNTVSIFLAKPDSTFAPKVDYPVGTSPMAIVAADFKGDGKMDLAVVNSTSNTVSILMGNGDGTFAPQTIVPVGGAPVGIVAEDFNSDGKIDLAVASSDQNEVDILLGNGDGTFAGETPIPLGFTPLTLQGGDFNGDGKLDLVTVDYGQEVDVLLSKGDGTFTSNFSSFFISGGQATVYIAVGDFDGDGILDLLTVTDTEWQFLKGLGNGLFEAPTVVEMTFAGFSVADSPIVVADFNRDGKLDFVSGNAVMLGLGSGIAFRQAPFTCWGTSPLIAADFNGDGVPDLVYPGSVFLGSGDGTFGQTPNYTLTGLPPALSALGPAPAVVGDFNGDGKPDVAVFGAVNNAQSAIVVGLGNGDGTFQPPVSSPIKDATYTNLTVADFNGDGKMDIIAWATTISPTTTQYLDIFPGNGDGTFQTAIQVSPPANAGTSTLAVADFNGDHKPDLAVITQKIAAGSNPAYVQILLGQGGGNFATGQAISLLPSPPNDQVAPFDAENVFMLAADFNNDGKMDLAVADSGTVAVLLGNGDGTFQNPAFYNCGGQGCDMRNFAVGDLNGDGKLDLVASGVSGFSVFLGNGDGTFQTSILTPVSLTTDPWSQIYVGDFNGDGKLDVAFWNGVAYGNGDGTFQPPIFNGYAPVATLVADFNSDGIPDVMMVSQGPGQIPIMNELLSAPQISLDPVALKFPSVDVGGASASQDVTVTDIGNVPLKFTKVAASVGYAQTNTCGDQIAAGANCVVSVTFTPAGAGNQSGTLTLTDNLLSSPQAVALSGTGLAPTVGLAPGSVTFGGVSIGATSSPQMVTLSNTGNAPLDISSITTEGDFAQTNNCGTGLGMGASCTIAVTFTPTAVGSLTGHLNVTDSAPNSPQSISLTGSGPDFTLGPPSGSPTTASVSPGQSATFSLSLGSVGGLTQTVSFNCTGAPSEATCTVSPTSATPGSASPNNISVSVTTTAPSSSSPRSRPPAPVIPLFPGVRGLLMLILGLAAIAWGLVLRNQLRKRWQYKAVLIATGLLLSLSLAGCGGGGGGGGPVGPSNPGTPAGTYTLTVTGTTGSGSSLLTHTVSLTLTVT
jgi:hypothetical protein